MNIYVSNLSFHTTEDDLTALFSKFGEVTSAKIILDKETSRSRGFAFVEMPSDEAGHEALRNLDNKEIEGRPLSVSVAKPKADRGGNNRAFSRGSSNRRW